MEKELIEKMLKNPKIIKAIEGIIAPLEQEGDTLTIKGLKNGNEI